jgi:hypothetical protein
MKESQFMNTSNFARCLVAAIVPFLVACGGATKVTSIRIDSDPAGADVEEAVLGYIGTTPLPFKITSKDLKKLGANNRVSVNLVISKKGYVSVKAPATWETGTHHVIKKTLQERLSQTEITSDPVGVGVFLLVLDDTASNAHKTAFKADPLTFYNGAPAGPGGIPAALRGKPEMVTQRFLGSTPTSYIYDPENELQNNDPLLFQKEGYGDQIVLFKVSQRRIHRIMKKIKP